MDDIGKALDDLIEWCSQNSFWIGFTIGAFGTLFWKLS